MDLDLCAFIKSLEHKSILITGSTGFIAKLFMEKLLRVQPHVKKIYLLIRAEDENSAIRRFLNEVINKELFRVLREEHGNGFDQFISEKVTVVAGDVSLENLGVEDMIVRDKLCEEINFIVNSAATTAFDERYDVALRVNAMGAKHVGEFAKRCDQLDLLMQVSTGFVAREQAGMILEKPFGIDDISKDFPRLNVDAELKLVEGRLRTLSENKLSKEALTMSMKTFGIQRATFHGWKNTYVYTKAMGEMLLGLMCKEVPLVIVRPTIVTSTCKEPFPGWIEGFRNLDPLIASYGKGKLRHFLVDPEGLMDAIPADMVINSMVVIMGAHYQDRCMDIIYHLSSSLLYPKLWSNVADWAHQYFSKNPLMDRNGKLIKVTRPILIHNLSSFYTLLTLRYKIPIMILRMINLMSFKKCGNGFKKLKKNHKFLVRLGEVYFSMTKFKGRFDDTNMERLREAMQKEDGANTIFLDPKSIDWTDYFVNVHIPGIIKYVLK